MMIDKKVLEKALAEILGELLANPLRYFSESDIHSIVYSEYGGPHCQDHFLV